MVRFLGDNANPIAGIPTPADIVPQIAEQKKTLLRIPDRTFEESKSLAEHFEFGSRIDELGEPLGTFLDRRHVRTPAR